MLARKNPTKLPAWIALQEHVNKIRRLHLRDLFATDALRFEMLRVAYFPPATSLQVGPMAASPKGRGFEVSFDPPSFPEG